MKKLNWNIAPNIKSVGSDFVYISGHAIFATHHKPMLSEEIKLCSFSETNQTELIPTFKHGDSDTNQDQSKPCNIVNGTFLPGSIFLLTDSFNQVVSIPFDLSTWTYETHPSRQVASTQSDIKDVGPSINIDPKYLEELIDRLFKEATEIFFEDGYENEFSKKLTELINIYGNRSMPEISYLITYNKVNYEVASEALRWIGRIVDTETYNWRLWLLEKSLGSNNPIVRDGAALGLATMGDLHSISSLEKAISKETCPDLLTDLKQIKDDLEAIKNAPPLKRNQKD